MDNESNVVCRYLHVSLTLLSDQHLWSRSANLCKLNRFLTAPRPHTVQKHFGCCARCRTVYNPTFDSIIHTYMASIVLFRLAKWGLTVKAWLILYFSIHSFHSFNITRLLLYGRFYLLTRMAYHYDVHLLALTVQSTYYIIMLLNANIQSFAIVFFSL